MADETNGKRAVLDVVSGAAANLLHNQTKANLAYLTLGGWVVAEWAVIGGSLAGADVTVAQGAADALGKVAPWVLGGYYALNGLISLVKNGNGVK